MAGNNPLLCTMTDEVFQPVRLYYIVHNKSGVQVGFKKLRCMDYDPRGQRWTWLYDGEAKKLNFKVPYSEIPIEKRPIILGSFYSRFEGIMYLDVCSIERAVTAAQFFDKHLRRMAAEVKYCAIYNKLTTGKDAQPGYCFDKLFADVRIGEIDADIERRAQEMTDAMRSGRINDVINSRRFDLIEAFPTYYYEEGIQQFEMSLQMRQAVAIKHWSGDTDYRLSDFINEGIKNMPPVHLP